MSQTVSLTYSPRKIEECLPDISTRVWGEEILLVETEHYSLKLLRYKSGTAGGLQYHTRKDETFTIHEGQALVDSDDGTGFLTRAIASKGATFHIPAGAVHRFTAITDCVVYEASTPVKNDRVRMERWYNEPEPDDVRELPSTSPEPVR